MTLSFLMRGQRNAFIKAMGLRGGQKDPGRYSKSLMSPTHVMRLSFKTSLLVNVHGLTLMMEICGTLKQALEMKMAITDKAETKDKRTSETLLQAYSITNTSSINAK